MRSIPIVHSIIALLLFVLINLKAKVSSSRRGPSEKTCCEKALSVSSSSFPQTLWSFRGTRLRSFRRQIKDPFLGLLPRMRLLMEVFGFAVGMLTEYATGSDFVDQVKILLSNFRILDLD